MPDGNFIYKSQSITRDNLSIYLKDLGKEFRKLNGTKMQAEIILIGGAAVLLNYNFRNLTNDVDAIINASSVMKEAINRVGDMHGLPNGWLNTDFKRTQSYSDKLIEVPVFYKTFSNILTVRTVSSEYLLAMKLKSGRQYKNDLSDIVGILWEQQQNNKPLTKESITNAFNRLYGEDAEMSEASRKFLDVLFEDNDYEALYKKVHDNEAEAKALLIEFERNYPNIVKSENINDIIDHMKQKESAIFVKEDFLNKIT